MPLFAGILCTIYPNGKSLPLVFTLVFVFSTRLRMIHFRSTLSYLLLAKRSAPQLLTEAPLQEFAEFACTILSGGSATIYFTACAISSVCYFRVSWHTDFEST